MAIYGCPRCGSQRVSPGRWFVGPVEFLHEPTSTMVCASCGERGIMLRFKDKRAADRYARSLQEAKP